MLDRRFWRGCVDAWIESKTSTQHLINGEKEYRYILSTERQAQWGGYFQPANKTTRLFPWLITNNIKQPNAKDIQRFLKELRNKGLRLTTINQRLYVIRDFFRYLNDHNIYQNDVANVVAYKIKSDNQHIRENITPDMMRKIAKLMNLKNIKGLRDLAILTLAYTENARINTLISLKKKDFVFNNNTNTYKMRFSVVKNKTLDSQSYDEITPASGKAISKYLIELENNNIILSASDPLFISTKNINKKNALLQTSVSKIAKDYISSLVKDGVIHESELTLYTAHSFRHGFMSEVSEYFGMNEANVLGGHKSVETTKRYIHTKNIKSLKKQKNIMFTNSVGNFIEDLLSNRMKTSA